MIRFTLTFLLPFATCYDTGVFSIEEMTGNGIDVYGIEATVLDKNRQTLYHSDVHESYVPPAPEMVPVTLAPGATSVECVIYGSSFPTNWSHAGFQIVLNFPELKCRVEGTNIVLSWDKSQGDVWFLETKTSAGWVRSPSTIAATDQVGLFRLNRTLR